MSSPFDFHWASYIDNSYKADSIEIPDEDLHMSYDIHQIDPLSMRVDKFVSLLILNYPTLMK